MVKENLVDFDPLKGFERVGGSKISISCNSYSRAEKEDWGSCL